MILREEGVSEKEDAREKLGSWISFLVSLILASMVCVWYYNTTPPDDPATQKLRLYFKENINQVMQFIQLPMDEQKAFAGRQTHPFYTMFLQASELEKEKIRAMVHVSIDYSPRQYWLNMWFHWMIWFTFFWFIGKIAEGILIILRDKEKGGATNG